MLGFLSSLWFHLRTGRLYVLKIWVKDGNWFVRVKFEILDAVFNMILRWDGSTLQIMDVLHLDGSSVKENSDLNLVICRLHGTTLTTWSDLCAHLELIHEKCYGSWSGKEVLPDAIKYFDGNVSALHAEWTESEETRLS